MKSLKAGLLFLAALAVAGSAAYVGYLQGFEKGLAAKQAAEANAPAAEAKEKPVAKVKVAPAVEANMRRKVEAYGTIVAVPEQTEIFSVPFEARAVRVLVKIGQKVEGGQDLIEIAPTPDALLALEEARTNRDGAAKDLANAQSRFDMKLATAQELQTAQQALQLAKGRLEGLEKKGIQAKRLQAPDDGIVSKIDTQEGQTVPANGPLLEVIHSDLIEVRLGVEPGQASQVAPNQPVRIQPVQDGAEPIEGKVRLVTTRVNSTSRLVDVFVSLPEDTPLLLDAYVKGDVEVASKKALVVPRSAVLPDEDKQVVYTVKDGNKAVRHEVTIGWEEEDRVEILPADEGGKAAGTPASEPASEPVAKVASLPASKPGAAEKQGEGEKGGPKAPPVQAGDLVVIEGNYELEDGMEVEVEPAGGEHEVH